MDKFLNAYELPKLNQENINYLNIPIMNDEIGVVIMNSSKKSPGLDELKAEFYQTLKEELISMIIKLFYEIKNSF
jgi:hypothetical protein